MNPHLQLSSRKTLSQYLFNSDFMLISEMKLIRPKAERRVHDTWLERSSEGQPAHTASGEDGTTGQRPSGENAAGAKRGRPAPGELTAQKEY
ncbi:hypothetical protein ES319_A03G146300v1 [Gossypium barbadense]|uniref:Uncharacterized protein n=1 Tax=Gossypium barbadense TaxID=3634 RepID=A0A5J5WDV4_GOSBA|nr:hypothetical protein ES319_A03G146300v1 [Gossypium barbadense]